MWVCCMKDLQVHIYIHLGGCSASRPQVRRLVLTDSSIVLM